MDPIARRVLGSGAVHLLCPCLSALLSGSQPYRLWNCRLLNTIRLFSPRTAPKVLVGIMVQDVVRPLLAEVHLLLQATRSLFGLAKARW